MSVSNTDKPCLGLAVHLRVVTAAAFSSSLAAHYEQRLGSRDSDTRKIKYIFEGKCPRIGRPDAYTLWIFFMADGASRGYGASNIEGSESDQRSADEDLPLILRF